MAKEAKQMYFKYLKEYLALSDDPGMCWSLQNRILKEANKLLDENPKKKRLLALYYKNKQSKYRANRIACVLIAIPLILSESEEIPEKKKEEILSRTAKACNLVANTNGPITKIMVDRVTAIVKDAEALINQTG